MPVCDNMSPLVSVVILNYNRRLMLKSCLESVQKQKGTDFEVVVVDNGSTDGSVEMVQRDFSGVKIVVNERNLGYAEGNNRGLSVARGKYVVFLNNDAYPADGWLSSLVSTVKSSGKVAIVGSKVFRRETNLLESAGGWIEYPLGDAPPRAYLKPDYKKYNKQEEVAYVSGAALLVKKDIMEKLEGFDPMYFCYHEETDFCWRARLAGYSVIYDPEAVVHHYGSFTTGKLSAQRIYWQSRNRMITNMKNFEANRLINWFVYEIANLFMILLGGLAFKEYRKYAVSYLKACFWVLLHIPQILVKRGKLQKLRRVRDEEILRLHKKTPLRTIISRYLKMVRTKSYILFAEENTDDCTVAQNELKS